MNKIAKMLTKRLNEMEGKEPSYKKFFRKHFGLPTVMELGWNDCNALESADFSDEPHGKTWEDYYAYMKDQFPVRYFFNEALPKFVKREIWWKVSKPIERLHYFLVSHLVLSRRHHMLDIREPTSGKANYHGLMLDDYHAYRYGWIDSNDKMLLSIFACLREYLSQGPYDLTKDYSREEINADPGLKNQQDTLEEARAILKWWDVGRKNMLEDKDTVLHLWSAARKAKDPKKEEYWTQMRKLDEEFDAKLDEMISRLMKIRRSLWV